MQINLEDSFQNSDNPVDSVIAKLSSENRRLQETIEEEENERRRDQISFQRQLRETEERRQDLAEREERKWVRARTIDLTAGPEHT